MARMRLALALTAILMVVTLGGCIDESEEFYGFDPDEHYRNPGVFPGSYRSGNSGSIALDRGELLPPLIPDVIRLVSARPAYGDAAGAMGRDAQVDIVMAIWRPDNYTEKMPIIVDAGPYFEQGDLNIETPSQFTPFLLANFATNGYAVVQMAVRGTGTAGGCMDLLGPDEAHDLDQAITWLGQQNWTNGNIAMIGASYDGSTPWEVAATGNPHLKTIVPISGLPDIYDLMFRNGSAETRGPIMHNVVYWGFGFDQEFPQEPEGWPLPGFWLPPAGIGGANGREEYQDRQNLLCPEVIEGTAMGAHATAGAGRGSDASAYWTERDYRQRVIDNYEGSVFLIHGLQDWNVDPHAAIPFNQELRRAGIEMKEWYGQWGHNAPDSVCDSGVPQWAVMPCRLDYAEVLRRWFEHYLRENHTIELGPSIQVQDNVGFWRNAESYPPEDAVWTPLAVGADGTLGPGAEAGDVRLLPPGTDGPGNVLQVASEPLPDGLHLSGMPRLEVPFTPEGEGGQIAAWLLDQAPDGSVRAPRVVAIDHPQDPDRVKWVPGGVPIFGHAQMDLRHYAGGDEPQPLVPGQQYIAKIEFEPLEVRVPAGHRLVLWIFQYHYPDRMDSVTPAPVTVHLGADAALRLPAMDVDPRTVFPVPGVRFPNTTYIPEMYVPLPIVPEAVGVPDAAGTASSVSREGAVQSRDATVCDRIEATACGAP